SRRGCAPHSTPKRWTVKPKPTRPASPSIWRIRGIAPARKNGVHPAADCRRALMRRGVSNDGLTPTLGLCDATILPIRQTVGRLQPKLRRLIAKSWMLSRCYYRYRGTRLHGRATDEVWYFAYGANMDDNAFRVRRGMRARECRIGHVKGYRLRF